MIISCNYEIWMGNYLMIFLTKFNKNVRIMNRIFVIVIVIYPPHVREITASSFLFSKKEKERKEERRKIRCGRVHGSRYEFGCGTKMWCLMKLRLHPFCIIKSYVILTYARVRFHFLIIILYILILFSFLFLFFFWVFIFLLVIFSLYNLLFFFFFFLWFMITILTFFKKIIWV